MMDLWTRRFARGLGSFVAVLALTTASQSQVPSALLVEDGAIPGAGGATADALNNTAVNHVGGYAVGVSSSDDLSRVWGNVTGGAGDVLRTESTIGDLEQTSFESFYGISDSGQVSYSASSTNTVTLVSGLDGVWLDDAVVALEDEPVASLAGQFWTFASRPGVTADGMPYFVGGISDSSGGGTQNRGLFFGLGTDAVILGFDVLPDLPFPIDDANGVDFDYRYSASGSRYIAPVQMETGSTATDAAIVVDGAGLLLGGTLVREGNAIPAVVGGLPDENWDNFDFTGITDSGKWFFSGDTDGDTGFDEIIVKNGVIAHREGDVLDGETLSGNIEGAYMNAQGDLAFIWDIQDNALEALYFNGQLLLKDGDPVDLDGDGAVEPDSVISSFTGLSTLTVGDQGPGGTVNIYFTADVDTLGTSSTTDDVEGFFCLEAQGAECFLVIGPAPGQTSFLPGSHLFKPQVSDVTSSYAVLLDDIPEFALPSRHSLVSGQALMQGGKSQELQLLADEFVVQVLMYNPFVFPDQPEQWTPGLHVQVLPTGRVVTQQFGDSTGMDIWAETETKPNGERVIRFPFSIPGL